LSKDRHLLLDYATNEILLSGKRINPPNVRGMSGGGVFTFRRKHPETIKLVGIMIEHHKVDRVTSFDDDFAYAARRSPNPSENSNC
jgi:hypothetical protein